MGEGDHVKAMTTDSGYVYVTGKVNNRGNMSDPGDRKFENYVTLKYDKNGTVLFPPAYYDGPGGKQDYDRMERSAIHD